MPCKNEYGAVVNSECKFSECYVTTSMCHILGYTDQCYVLTEMRNFKNNILQQNPEYSDTLLEDDIVELMIAESIEKEYEETHNKDMWTRFYQLFLLQTVNLIAAHNYKEAVCKYQKMIEVLKSYFGIQDTDIIFRIVNCDNYGKLKIKRLATSQVHQ